MFENYLATKEDLETIEEAFKYVWDRKLDFIFQDKSKIENTIIISYDSKLIYVWSHKKDKKYDLQKIAHKLKILDEWQEAWWATPISERILEYLPNEIKTKNKLNKPIINGGLLLPFVELQKIKKISNNPYITKESYIATIIHEFGHVYWNGHKLWWFSNKKENLSYLRAARNLYILGDKHNLSRELLVSFPSPFNLGEVFAFCTEYYASSIFWKKHNENLNSFIKGHLNRFIYSERNKNLDQEDSIFELNKSPHNFSFVIGKIILRKYPASWPQILTHKMTF